MADALLNGEVAIRLGCFAGVLAVVALWEAVLPRRPRAQPRGQRWAGNLGVVVLGALLVRVLFPVVPVAWAVIVSAKGWGLFNALGVPATLAVPLAVVLLDLAIYAQHVAFHMVPALWRLHRMHHADLDFDVTTGVRFHPIEIALSILIKMVVIALIGAPAVAVLVFEVLLNATSMFNHANASLPPALDRVLRLILVTPDMHRVHHSVIGQETNSNYGFNLPWWDRLFGTYRAEPQAGHDGMTIGLPIFRDPKWLRLDRLVVLPFVDDDGAAPKPG